MSIVPDLLLRVCRQGRTAARALLLSAIVFAAGVPASFGWGCDGHKTVASIAYERLNPRAKAEAIALLAKLAPNPTLTHYCTGDANKFVEVSTWADDIRIQRPETGPWHYVDLPLGAKKYDKKYCPAPEGCILLAIHDQLAILRDSKATAQDRSMALLFIIHFLGDLHQPLHDTSNNDRGGNCVPVDFFGNPPQEFPNESFRPNLHGIWDTDLVTKAMAGRPVVNYALYLEGKYASESVAWAKGKPNVTRWAIENEKVAQTIVYGKLPAAIAVEKPVEVKLCSDDNHISQRLLALHETIGAPYVAATQEAMEQQIAKAGVRLAAILNQLWK